MNGNTGVAPGIGGVTFYHPAAFWLGVACVIFGVFSHWPMWQMSAAMGYRMAGMPMDALMVGGMAAIVAGIGLSMWGLLPRSSEISALRREEHESHIRVHALDNVALNPQHYKLFAVILVALVVDTMKPATLGFVLPGMVQEYGIPAETVKWLPFFALTGTTVGSVLWGMLADVIGRRSTILLSALMFVGTAICGAMPSFEWNLGMCFLMGMSAGGLLPIVFTLLAETVPMRHRGWSLVLLGGAGTIGGYALAALMASILEPVYGWRALWFLGLPTGLTLILLNRFIPESPRFLMIRNRREEARRVMRLYGAVIDDHEEEAPAAIPAPVVPGGRAPRPIFTLFHQPYLGITVGMTLCGVAWSMVNWGFLLWLPNNLRHLGMDVETCNTLIKNAVFLAFPVVFIASWLYHAWSSKRTFLLFLVLTVLSLLSFMLLDNATVVSPALMLTLVMMLLASSTGVISVLLPYSAEVYPNHVRGTGTGLIAGSSKFGGIAAQLTGPFLSGLGLATFAAALSVPVLASAAVLVFKGVETRGRSLEDMHREPDGEGAAAVV